MSKEHHKDHKDRKEKNPFQKLSNQLGFLATIVALVGGFYAIENRYAKAEEVKTISLRLEQKILIDRHQSIQERMWKYEERYPEITSAPENTREEYRQLQNDYKMIELSLDEITSKMGATK